ncbi:hypothetical protein CAPTEDRAFT_103278 [Capitella teleta]|uniref:Guanylate cyclase n=2 Tax=Capitella teleta TaxID=283909 RepID=R7UWK9_CAPTE|nr:hypothetical protein CAPTEDRAFT_103278 [Capitella teleta]|eukprot:ELU07786.1 hypothetical protein CAPTEDRAFT_103278 [Capitella teleta]
MTHENINSFVGACVDPGNICLLFGLCSKGSLQDILENDEIKLDWMFKMALVHDLINGMAHLHSTLVHSHGSLTSANCLVDSRWVLKIAGFGLHAFRTSSTGMEQNEYAHYRDMLWTSPELLRLNRSQRPAAGTQKGDVYSFAIVLQEVIYRALPYFVIEKVIDSTAARPFRPRIPSTGSGADQSVMVAKMKECWAEDPNHRPSFSVLKQFLRKLNKGRKTNIMDNMIAKLEKYASNLEDVVSQRTAQLMEEKKKTDSLLYRMLPRVVAEELKSGHSADAELYDQVTVYFSDIVDFTVICSASTPMQVVQVLNDLYTRFDAVIEAHDVYKVETIGDAYMLVSGLPHRNEHHVAVVAEVSLCLQFAVKDFRFRHLPERRMRLRIGIHTGPCAAGVVGQTMPRYCLFGDTVNVASRMESTGEACKIHLSESSAKALMLYPKYVIEKRGEIEVKGKGCVTTYWLTAKIPEP